MSNSWFETFFSGVATDCWRNCLTPEVTRAEVDFLAWALRREPPARFLDVACGNGRHAIALAHRGFAVTGLDISGEYIAEARAASAQAGVDVEWVHADMRSLDRVEEFDGAYSFGNTFGYLEHEDTVKFLGALGRALRAGARFVLQTGAVAECLLPRFREREWYQIDDILFAEENRYRAEASCVETTYTFVRDGKTEVRPGSQYVYTVGEVRRMLAVARLRTVGLFRSTDRAPFNLGCEQLLLIAEKD